MSKIPVKVWKQVITNSDEHYPISDKYISDGFSQISRRGKDGSPINSEKEHALGLLESKDINGEYYCDGLLCIELLLYLAEAWKVDSEKIEKYAEQAKQNLDKGNIRNRTIVKGKINIAPLVMEDIYKKYQESLIQ